MSKLGEQRLTDTSENVVNYLTKVSTFTHAVNVLYLRNRLKYLIDDINNLIVNDKQLDDLYKVLSKYINPLSNDIEKPFYWYLVFKIREDTEYLIEELNKVDKSLKSLFENENC